jgi:hypothetical protein
MMDLRHRLPEEKKSPAQEKEISRCKIGDPPVLETGER